MVGLQEFLQREKGRRGAPVIVAFSACPCVWNGFRNGTDAKVGDTAPVAPLTLYMVGAGTEFWRRYIVDGPDICLGDRVEHRV